MVCGTAVIANSLASILYMLAVIAIMVIAIGLMLGMVPPSDAVKQIAAVLGAVTVLVLALHILYAIWSGMSLTARASLIFVAIFLWWWKHRAQKETKK